MEDNEKHLESVRAFATELEPTAHPVAVRLIAANEQEPEAGLISLR